MRRVLVIGSGGAGKSTLARRLGERLGLPVIHLDACFWRPGWVETPKEEWRQKVEELCAREAWVMDGNFSATLEARLAACDTVVFLDLPRTVCVWRALKRLVMYRNKRRPDMAEGCGEKFSLKFLHWVWTFPSRTRPKVLERIGRVAVGKRVFRLRSSAEVERFLAEAG
jgi:adenylate kinase family enzyme